MPCIVTGLKKYLAAKLIAEHAAPTSNAGRVKQEPLATYRDVERARSELSAGLAHL